MIPTFLQVTALGLSLASAYFLSRGDLGRSPETIADLAIVRTWLYNPRVVHGPAQQAADTEVGWVFLLFGVVCQIASLRWPIRHPHWPALFAALVFCFAAGGVGYLCAERDIAKTVRTVEQITKAPRSQPKSP